MANQSKRNVPFVAILAVLSLAIAVLVLQRRRGPELPERLPSAPARPEPARPSEGGTPAIEEIATPRLDDGARSERTLAASQDGASERAPRDIEGVALDGRVVTRSGRPAPGVEVFYAPALYTEIQGAPTRVVRTDDEGRFVIEATPGIYALWAQAASGVSHVLHGRIAQGARASDLRLELVPETREISGVVLDANGQPAGGVTVLARSQEFTLVRETGRLSVVDHAGRSATAETAKDGTFRIEGLADVETRLTFELSGRVHGHTSVPTALTRVEFRLGEIAGLRINIEACDGSSGDIRARLFQSRTEFSSEVAEGHVRFDGLDPDEYSILLVSSPGCAHHVAGFEPVRDSDAPEPVVLRPGSALRGQLSTPGGDPLVGVRVTLRGGQEIGPPFRRSQTSWLALHGVSIATSDSDGAFEFRDLPAGPYDVSISHPSGIAPIRTVSLPANDALHPIVVEDPKVTLTWFATIARDARSGAPLERFDLHVLPAAPDSSVFTGQTRDVGKERAVVGAFPPGEYTLRISSEGYADAYVDVRPYGPGENEVDVAMKPAAEFTVRLLSGSGLPLENFSVAFGEPGGPSLSGREVGSSTTRRVFVSDARGIVRVLGLPRGWIEVRPMGTGVRIAGEPETNYEASIVSNDVGREPSDVYVRALDPEPRWRLEMLVTGSADFESGALRDLIPEDIEPDSWVDLAHGEALQIRVTSADGRTIGQAVVSKGEDGRFVTESTLGSGERLPVARSPLPLVALRLAEPPARLLVESSSARASIPTQGPGRFAVVLR